MKKTKINPYEIHYIKVESVNTNNSVIGADNKLYKYSQRNNSYPFRIGDTIILMCSKNYSDGMYNIDSFVNLTNGTRKIESQFGSVIVTCIVSTLFTLASLEGKITIGSLFFLLIWIPLWVSIPVLVYKLSYKVH